MMPKPGGFEHEHEAVMAYVVSYMACGMCNGTYRLEDVQVVDKNGAIWAMTVRCPQCGAEGVILAFAVPVPMDESELNGAPVDLTESGLTTLTDDDVLEWRAYLNGFDGDMEDLLRDDAQ